MIEFKPFASGSAGNLYMVDDGETKLLLECGIPLAKIKQALGYRLSEVGGCLITHCHLDHCKAAKDLTRCGVDVYASRGTLDALGMDGHRAHALKHMEETAIGTFRVLPFDVRHDAPGPLGFLITSPACGERLLFISDSHYTKYRFPAVNIIAAECNYDAESLWRSVGEGRTPPEMARRIVKSHTSLDTLLGMLKANDTRRARQVWLMHLSAERSDEKRIVEAVREQTGAEVYACLEQQRRVRQC